MPRNIQHAPNYGSLPRCTRYQTVRGLCRDGDHNDATTAKAGLAGRLDCRHRTRYVRPRGHRVEPRRKHRCDVVHRRGCLRLCTRLPLLQRVSRREGFRSRSDARHASGAFQRRPRFRADEPLDRVRPSLRGDCGPGPADRPDAGGAVRLSPRHAVDSDRRRPRRLRAGLRRAVLLDPPRRPLARPNGARRARPHRRRGRIDRRAWRS